MRNTLKIALVAAAMTAMVSAAATAKVIVINNTSSSVWYTIYGAYGDIVDYGCTSKGNTRTYSPSGWGSSGTSGSLVYVRGELKQNVDCGGKTMSDTGRGGTLRVPGNGLVRTFNVVNGKIRQ